MPYRPELDQPDARFQPAAVQFPLAQNISTDWRDRLPTLLLEKRQV